MGKLVITIPSDAVLIGNEIWDEENGNVLMEFPLEFLNECTREMIQRTIDSDKFEITVYTVAE